MYTYVCLSGGKKLQFFDKFSLLCFLVSNVLGFALCLITDKLISRIFIYSFNEYGYNGKITLFSQTITLQRKSDENMNKSILIAFRLGYTTLPREFGSKLKVKIELARNLLEESKPSVSVIAEGFYEKRCS